MKRRVSFLLMLVLALALVLALTSCGECEHLNTETKQEVTAYGNCKVADKIDDVTVCADCGEELSRISRNGEIGEHVAGDPVYENLDVLDCTKGGTCDEVVYCTVARCGAEISRKTGVEVKAATKHTLSSRAIFDKDHSLTTVQMLRSCSKCAYQVLEAPTATEKTALASTPAAHLYQPAASGTCKYCYDVLGNSNFEYIDNGDGTYTLKSIRGNAPQALFIGHYNGKPVTHIAENAFAGQTTIRAVTLGDCVKFVGAGAFSGCSNIESVFTYNLESWAEINFANAEANPLHASKAIFRPNGIAVDASKVFTTKGFTKIGSYAFAGLKANSVYIAPETTEIGEGAFANCATLLNVYFQPATSRTVGAKAFENCENIRKAHAESMASWLCNSFDDIKANPTYYADALYFGDKKFDSDTLDLDGIVSVPKYAFTSLGFTTVKIPKELVTIGSGAFAGCKNLATVVFESGSQLGDISASTFVGCSALAEIELPASVKTIGNNAFEGCSALTEAPLNDSITSIGQYAFKGCSALASVKLPSGLTLLSKGIFENCSALTDVQFGADLETIETSAFANCSAITELNFPAKIESIGDKAFSGCRSLAKIDLERGIVNPDKAPEEYTYYALDNLDKIGVGAFAGCTGAKKILVSTSVSEIGLGAFEGCSSVKSISVPFIGKAVGAAENNFGYIFGATTVMGKDESDNDIVVSLPDNGAFVPYSLSDIIISGNIETIAPDAFKDCEGAVTIKLPATVKSIGANAFEGCTGLDAVYFSSVEKWCQIEFANYLSNPLSLANTLYFEVESDSVTALTISTNVAPYAFYGASEIFYGDYAITSFVIGDGVTAIGNDAFHGCLALESITLPTTLNSVGARAFFGCDDIGEVKISDLTAWCGVKFADVFANPLYYTDKLYVAGNAVTEIVVSANVNKYAFAGCEFITKVTFSDAVTEISDGAFYGCVALKSLSLPKVTKICANAFEGCSALESVSLGVVVEIGAKAFADCVSLKDTLVIPDTVTVIGNEAFLNCAKITKVTLGSALKTIGVAAFYNCKTLEEVNIPATVTVIGTSAFGECSLVKVAFANANGWTVNAVVIASTDLSDADADAALAKAAAKLVMLSAYEWTRS